MGNESCTINMLIQKILDEDKQYDMSKIISAYEFADKYGLFEESLWQTSSSGKYIGLDHQTALGANGLSLNEFYSGYSNSEGSNLDGGKTSDGKAVNADPSKTTTSTTKPVVTTTTTSDSTTSTSSTTTTVTTTPEVSNRTFGDSNCDGTIDMSDVVLMIQL